MSVFYLNLLYFAFAKVNQLEIHGKRFVCFRLAAQRSKDSGK